MKPHRSPLGAALDRIAELELTVAALGAKCTRLETENERLLAYRDGVNEGLQRRLELLGAAT